MKKRSSFSGVCTPEKREEIASCNHTFFAHTEDEDEKEDRRVLGHEKPFFLKISQIRPGFYRFNTIVRLVSCPISSFISLSSSFFLSSSSVDTSPFSSPSDPDHLQDKKKKNRHNEDDFGVEKEEEEEEEDAPTTTLKEKAKKKKMLLSEVLVEDETGGMQIRLILRGEKQHAIACQGGRGKRGKWLVLRNASTSTVGGVLSLEVREEIGGQILDISNYQHKEMEDAALDGIPNDRGEEKKEEEGEVAKEKKKRGSSSFCLSSIPLVPLSRAL
ncbi:hypothetical protein CSUI_002162 [Cystoisospora suis]|uniref:Uncharacterized protein n=1 Tax=Cystoisospora suis TaxID=483139 RepID=A0A2C6L9V5_9APIC|nr:hypothetical protein CSUI_002162 [Cystoisospora suis]